MLLVFLHGWGVRNPDYGALPQSLREPLGANVLDVWLSDYISYSDSLSLEDLAEAFERARRETFPGVPFACVTHSTGGLLARLWLATHGRCGEGRGLMTHLVMLAPPIHGSALAQLEKGRLARMAFWLADREPGEQILDWLELGSLKTWKLNLRAMDEPPEAFLFSLIGSGHDEKLYDHLNSYTGERGSDGVVRIAAANLNYSTMDLQQAGRTLNLVEKQRTEPAAFGILPGLCHSGTRMGILSSITEKNASKHQAAKWIQRCLRVESRAAYRDLTGELAATLETAQEAASMIVFKVVDCAGRSVTDFDLYLTAGSAYSPDRLPKNFFLDRQRNQSHPNALTYYINRGAFAGTDELGLKIVARPQSGPMNYGAAEFRSHAATVQDILRPHETVMIQITLERRLEQAVLQLRRAA